VDRPAGIAEGSPAELLAVGRVGPAHGNRGEVLVEPWTDAPELRFAPGAVLQTEPAAIGPLTVASHRFAGDRLIVSFVGVDDRDSVVALRSTVLLIAAADRPSLDDPDEYYDTDLVGLEAVSPAGAAFGPVLDVGHLTGAVYLQLRVDGVERMVPFVSTMVPEVDVAGGRIVIDPPDGLFEL
jgi:16S rRNA processing protein RimM